MCSSSSWMLRFFWVVRDIICFFFFLILLQRLDDPRASNSSFSGEIVCHIPEVEETTTTGVGARWSGEQETHDARLFLPLCVMGWCIPDHLSPFSAILWSVFYVWCIHVSLPNSSLLLGNLWMHMMCIMWILSSCLYGLELGFCSRKEKRKFQQSIWCPIECVPFFFFFFFKPLVYFFLLHIHVSCAWSVSTNFPFLM